MKTPPPLWATCTGVWPPLQGKRFFLILNEISCLYPLRLLLSLDTTEESGTILYTCSHKIVHIDEIPLETSSWGEQSQLSHLNQLCGFLLDSLQCVRISFESGNPELDPVLQILHHCWTEVKNHLLLPAGNAFPSAAQEAFGLHCHMGALMTHVRFVVYKDSQIIFWRKKRETITLWLPQCYHRYFILDSEPLLWASGYILIISGDVGKRFVILIVMQQSSPMETTNASYHS